MKTGEHVEPEKLIEEIRRLAKDIAEDQKYKAWDGTVGELQLCQQLLLTIHLRLISG